MVQTAKATNIVSEKAKFSLLHTRQTVHVEPHTAAILPPSCKSSLCLQIFKNGNRAKPIDYDGPREADGIVSEFYRTLGAMPSQAAKYCTSCGRNACVYRD